MVSLTQISLANRSTGTCVCLFTAHGHISSVRTLSATTCPLPKLQPSEQINTNTFSDRNCHLLFSGGGRASLKCWRVDMSLIDVDDDSCHGDKVTSSPMVFLGEYLFRFSNHRRRRKKQDLQSLSEIRFMSLTSLCAIELIDSCQSMYFVMAGCSDGFVRWVFGTVHVASDLNRLTWWLGSFNFVTWACSVWRDCQYFK